MNRNSQVDVGSAEQAPRDNYVNVLKAIESGEFCPFCEENLFIHHKEPILFRKKLWLITKNAWAYKGTKYHFLLISKVHIESIEEGPADLLKELQSAYKKLCKQFSLKGASLVIRSGDTAYTGGTVKHLHAQVIVGVKRKPTTEHITAVVGYKNK